MRIMVWIVLLIAGARALSGQSGRGISASTRSAALPADVDPNSLNRLPVVKREEMDEIDEAQKLCGTERSQCLREQGCPRCHVVRGPVFCFRVFWDRSYRRMSSRWSG